MGSASYSDPRLAALYDRLNAPPRRDWDFYTQLAGAPPATVLDMGCGTGWLAVQFAGLGHRVTGADPAAAMLDIARRRPGGEAVAWVQSTAPALDIATRFDLAFMSGHAFQNLLGDDEIAAALAALRRHLAPGGRIAFETRNPAVRAWEGWVAEDIDVVELGGHGRVEVGYQTVAVEGELVTYEIRFRFGPDDTAVATDRLRFLSREGLARLLAGAGFKDITWYGDWDASPVGPSSPELIVVAR